MASRIRSDSQLFEVFVEAERAVHEDGRVDTQLQFVHPIVEQDLLNSLTKFVFPFDSSFQSNSVDCFTFVLTDGDGTFKFGFCRLSTNSNICHCLISYYPWFCVFYPLLNYLVELKKTYDLQLLIRALDSIISIKHSPIGKHISSKVDPCFEFVVPDQSQLMTIPTSINLTEYFCAVDVKHMMEIFASTLLERRIIVVSRRLSRLTACIHSASAFLFPFHWQHIFIPILPPHLLDYCSAPMPFLIGVHSSLWSKINKDDLGDVLILDADDNSIHSSFNDLNRLPQIVVTQLKKNLDKGKSCCSKGDIIPRAFLKVLTMLFGGYRMAFKTEHGRIVFDADAFVMTRPSAYHPFLRCALQLQIFQQFIEERLTLMNSGTRFSDIFEEEIKNMEQHEKQKGKSVRLSDHKLMKLLKKADKSQFTSFLENLVGGCSSNSEVGTKPQKSQTPSFPKKILQKFPRKLSGNFAGDMLRNDSRKQLSLSKSSDGFLKHLDEAFKVTEDCVSCSASERIVDLQHDEDVKDQTSNASWSECVSLASSYETFIMNFQGNIDKVEETGMFKQASPCPGDTFLDDVNNCSTLNKSVICPQSTLKLDVDRSNLEETMNSKIANMKVVSKKIQHLINIYEKKEANQLPRPGTLNPAFPGTYFPPNHCPSSIAERRADLQASTEQWKKNYRSRNIADLEPLNSKPFQPTFLISEGIGDQSNEKILLPTSCLNNVLQNDFFSTNQDNDTLLSSKRTSGSLSRRLAFKANKSQSSSDSQRGSMYLRSLRESLDKSTNSEQHLSPQIDDEESSVDDIYSTPPTYPNSLLGFDDLISSHLSKCDETKQNCSIQCTSYDHQLTSNDDLSINSTASSYSSILSADYNEASTTSTFPRYIGRIAPVSFQKGKSAASMN